MAHLYFPGGSGSVGSGGGGVGSGGTVWSFEDAGDLSDFTFKRCQADVDASSYVSRVDTSASVGTYSLEDDTDYIDEIGIITGDTDTTFTLDIDFQFNSGEDQYAGLFYGSYRDESDDLFDGVCLAVNNNSEVLYLCSYLTDGNPDIYTPDDTYDFSGDSLSDGSWYNLHLDVAHTGTSCVVSGSIRSQNRVTTYGSVSNTFTSDGSWTTDKGLYMYNVGEPTTKQRVDYLEKDAS